MEIVASVATGEAGEAAGPRETGEAAGARESAPQRGQGLFVAKTYMAKMGGTIAARNADDGVWFVLTLPRTAG